MFVIRILRSGNVERSYCTTPESSSSLTMETCSPYRPKKPRSTLPQWNPNVVRSMRHHSQYNKVKDEPPQTPPDQSKNGS